MKFKKCMKTLKKFLDKINYFTKKDRWHSQMKSGKGQIHDLIKIDNE